jgi:choline-glycine betaine transporter
MRKFFVLSLATIVFIVGLIIIHTFAVLILLMPNLSQKLLNTIETYMTTPQLKYYPPNTPEPRQL